VKVKTKIFSVILVIVVVFTAVTSVIVYFVAAGSLKGQICEHLETAASSRAKHIQTFLREHRGQVETLAGDILLKNALEVVAANPDSAGADMQLVWDAGRQLEKVLEREPHFYEILVLDRHGVTVFSTNSANIGMDKSDDAYFLEGKKGSYIKDAHYSASSRQNTLAISSPISTEASGEFLGMYVARLSIAGLNEITSDTTGLGRTGEIYILNHDMYMVTQSRFAEDTFLKQKVNTKNARDCFGHETESLEHNWHQELKIFEDYRGVAVLGTHAYIPEMDWALLVEIDKAEAMSPLISLLCWLFWAGLLCIAIAVSIARGLAEKIGDPIIRLQESAAIIGQGNLDVEIEVESGDEIGQLADSFRDMTKNLSKTTTSVDKLNVVNRQYQASQQQLETILNSIQAGVVIIEEDTHKIEYVNPAAAKMTKIDADRMVGKVCHKFICPIERGHCPISDLGQDVDSSEKILLKANDQEMDILKTVTPITLDGKKCLIETFVDITVRRETERELEYTNTQLEKSIGRANQMAQEAALADQSKSEFLANMSHEIRTPMNVIIGFSDILAEDELSNEQLGNVNLIRDAAQNLLILINDILDFSKIEAGKFDVETVDCSMAQLITGIDSMMSPTARGKGLDFKIVQCDKLPANIKTDPTRVRQCLINLVNNAIKFTSRGHVYVNINMLEEDDKPFICFDVEDTGIGIPKDRQEAIFDAFNQADGSTTRKYGGTGLGLAITRQLSEILGGRLSLSSETDKGSVFSLVIPANIDINSIQLLDKAYTTAHSQQSQQQASGAVEPVVSGNILVAEDARPNQILIRKLLEKYGLKVTIVENGAEAVEAVTKDNFDIIFMDIQMPVMNGYDAAKTLRKNGVKTSVVALTANAMKGDDQKCLDAGFDEYMSKPIKRDKLTEVLKKYLSKEKKGDSVRDKIDSAKNQINQFSQMCSDVASDSLQEDVVECPIEWAFVMETCGEEEIIEVIVGCFLDDVPGMLQALQQAIEEGNVKDIRLYAHKVKGSALNIGARKLGEKVALVEDAGDDGDVKTAGRLFDAVETELDRAVAFLSEPSWIEKAKQYGKESIEK
jgi:signal transduction histidine kinase/CheY-like chemotaxis protein/HAMP domain-containing protein